VRTAAATATPTAAATGDVCPDARWFAVWTRSQCEPTVAARLCRKRFEVFLPRVRVASRRRDRRLVLERPLFPGYLFVRFVPSRRSYVSVASTDGAVRILGERWDALDPLPDEQVEAVRRIVTTAEGARVVPWIRIGDRVRVIAGPLAGLEGFVQAWRAGRATFVVSVDLLQRSVGLEVAGEVLERT
jgi:transcriptional antiterminator NusG